MFFRSVLHCLIDERVKIKRSHNIIFSKDVPMIAADKYNLRYFGWLKGFHLLINRAEGAVHERMTSVKQAVRVLEAGCRVPIFAEGGMLNHAPEEELIYDIRTRQPILRMLKGGVGLIASLTGAKIIAPGETPPRAPGLMPKASSKKLGSFVAKNIKPTPSK